MKCLNIGCGFRQIKSNEADEWINIDFNAAFKPDIVWDLEGGLPFSIMPDSIDFVYTTHTLEHIRNLIELMKAIHRVCKHGASVYIKVPPLTYEGKIFEGCFRDPTHVRYFTTETFMYFDHTTPEGNLYDFPFFKVISAEIIKPGVDPELEFKLMVIKNGKN